MYEPKYRCTLCCVTAEIDPIYQHLVGAKHRTKYIKNILGQPVHTKETNFTRIISSSKTKLFLFFQGVAKRSQICLARNQITFGKTHLVGAKHRTFDNSLIVSGVSLYYLFESFVVVSLFPIDSEYESVMPQTQLEKEVVDCNLLINGIDCIQIFLATPFNFITYSDSMLEGSYLL